MKITTTENDTTIFLDIDCEDSTAVKEASVVIPKDDLTRASIIVVWKNGDEWGYKMPNYFSVLALMGEESVGRFINTIKREAVYTRFLRSTNR